ncbi:MAG: hypothetical protein KF852_09060 [Saprospiraceae bacterium]|nr:hypothetical protein [Saprospiraceae bacterium]
MKFKIALVIFFVFSCLAVHYGQHDRNTLYVHHTPQITRTFFEAMLETNPGLFIDFVETAPANRPIQSHSIGGGYRRQFGKLSIGLHFSQNLRGQRSAYAFNYRGAPNTDTTRNYGGLYYHFKTKSFSFGISGGLTLLSNEEYAGGPEITLGIDVFHYAYAEEFTIRPGEGTLGGGVLSHGGFPRAGQLF